MDWVYHRAFIFGRVLGLNVRHLADKSFRSGVEVLKFMPLDGFV